ncbi:CMGC/SRPK protein kinase [Trichophyton equinum CBS 127.97]|uniref:non-specific serine/threonine protein kinase n=1 Tax=Trichophyton equinum (strain ATCC MYA-4606 / CBS 127.97) TaxID=559882 RepID=F2PVP9_TRIEC|nr:CMGC/SRPK protein kinase [Trichophyton equinum CBS 127.97]
MIGDVLHDRYKVVDKLGFGGYATIWLARDSLLERYVALKVGIADSHPRETRVLRDLSASASDSTSSNLSARFRNYAHNSIPVPLDEFKIHGPNGMHPCYTMTPAQCNLWEASYSRLFHIDIARALSAAVTLSVTSIHSRGFVHGAKFPSSFDNLSVDKFYEEYGKPETVPITRSDGSPLPPNAPAQAVLPISFGKHAEDFTLTDSHVPMPPEARFEPDAPMSYSADIWGLAVAVWEIVGMKAIWSCEFATPDSVTKQHIEVLGPMPVEWWERWDERHEYFDENGKPTQGREVRPPLEQAFEEGVQKYRRKIQPNGVFSEEETTTFLNLMRQMLAFRPEERPTALQVLQSEWMVKWAFPEFERSLEVKVLKVREAPEKPGRGPKKKEESVPKEKGA